MRGKDDGRSGRYPETIEAGMGFVCEVGQYRWIVNMMRQCGNLCGSTYIRIEFDVLRHYKHDMLSAFDLKGAKMCKVTTFSV